MNEVRHTNEWNNIITSLEVIEPVMLCYALESQPYCQQMPDRLSVDSLIQKTQHNDVLYFHNGLLVLI